MNPRRFPSSLFPLLIIFVFQVKLGIPQSLGYPDRYTECRNPQFKCGNISAGYPFSGDGIPSFCGHPGLQLDCENDTPTIEIVNVKYQVLAIHTESQTIRIARQDFIKNNLCDPEFPNSILDNKLFDFIHAPGFAHVTLLYDCLHVIQTNLGHFNCSVNRKNYRNVWVVPAEFNSSVPCSANVTVPVLRSPLAKNFDYLLLLGELNEGFEVKWKLDSIACSKCIGTGGACGFGFNSQTICLCPNATNPWAEIPECPHGKGLAVAVTIAMVCTICFIVLIRFKGESLSTRNSIHLWQRNMNNNVSVEAFIKEFGSLAPKRYFYTDIKKMTNKFKDKLGQGGYGHVYKGKLPDGRLVAVKVLSETKGNGEEFMNEVASIGRTSHVNIVTLLGFCYDKSKRALVYEFMPHGSLDKFIYNQGSQDQSRRLEWKTLYDIALGIARGLEYLHQGCNTRILHFDIKPHNILLDEDFFPKISDFGLSRLCERKESIISMTGARGTAGYIAPEVFCRNFGRVSYKSDVYSYGMMVLEMVGGRKNIDVEVSQSSEIYFPSWIYKHLDQAMNLSLDGVTTEEEEEITRRLIVVSLWCIQTNPTDRPSMTKVLEMFQGSLQLLVMPPAPFISSPARSPETASTT
ncbi:LEAF RUST 10 DISEASE-RESISTANCE LOCUS RECEPTOR-LIKE PROTEIN KINASE-like 2.4 isoform X2 [Durio zibethinus]|uniref:non-specific serine/threonine protein kinase n=1 Tax=Durio zibethinus TaxID=66656 RepID=A0A6P6B511_DURZI|nr:LEAF RUST 10 DISEASE-RESISTANCE LOCUS RECEPTOR-LIKE PROTEIN KINASE-like 2.4 isoform X2 [Durio zibethinus]